MKAWIAGLTTASTVVGAAVLLYGAARFVTAGAVGGLLVALAIVIVGPLEDLLQGWARRRAPSPDEGEARATVVDRVTSIAFLVLLGVTIALL